MINIEIAYFYNWKLGLVVLYIAYLSFVYTENGDYVRKIYACQSSRAALTIYSGQPRAGCRQLVAITRQVGVCS
jgi:hypothetical protein